MSTFYVDITLENFAPHANQKVYDANFAFGEFFSLFSL